MSMWARIESGRVAELTGEDPSGRFHHSIQWVECDPGVCEGWLFDGISFSAPIVPALNSADVMALRSSAFRAEADPLKIEAEYDALIAAADPDYTEWLAKVAEIKERYPLPS